jgi:hypothetical protein
MPDADFTGRILHTTDMAVKFYKDGDSIFDAVWLPRSAIAVVHLPDKKVRITVPEFLAEEKGLL